MEWANHGKNDRNSQQLSDEGSLPVERITQMEEVNHLRAKSQHSREEARR
jgi:hypothetical protein